MDTSVWPQVPAILLDASAKAAIVLAIAFAAAHTAEFRRASAHLRQWWWRVAIIATMAVPLLSYLLPPVETTVWPEALRTADRMPNATFTMPAFDVVVPQAQDTPATPTAATPAARTMPRKELVALLITAAWLAGSGFVLGRWALGLVRLHRMTRRGAEPDASWNTLCARLAERLQLRTQPRILMFAARRTPMTWGIIRPVIALPESAGQWDPQRRELVLMHELLHIKRFDWLFLVAARSACALYWFNPFLWLAARRLDLEREMACDDGVLRNCRVPSDYAHHLLEIAQSLRHNNTRGVPALAFGFRTPLETRLRHILAERKRTSAYALVAMLPVIVLVAVVVSAIEPAGRNGGKIAIDQSETAVFLQHTAQLLRDKQWDQAIEMLEPVTRAEPENATVLFRLGFALHYAGRHDEAIAANTRVLDLNVWLAPVAKYNIACSLSMSNRPDEAIDAIADAIELGFCRTWYLREDADLEPLHTLPRFKQLYEKMQICEEAINSRSADLYR